MLAVIAALFPVISLIVGGYVLHQSKFLSKDFWSGADRLNYFILFPSLLFQGIATAKIDVAVVQQIVVALAVVFGVAIACLYVIKAMRHTPPQRFGVYMQGLIRFSTYMGLSMVSALFHQQGLVIFSIILALTIPFVNVVSIIALLPKERLDLSSIFMSVSKNPLTVACLIGVLFNLLHIQLYEGVTTLLKLIAGCSLPLGLLCVGAALNFLELRKNVGLLVLNTAARLLAMPALAYLVCSFLQISSVEKAILVIFFALPTAPTAYVQARQFHADSHMMAGIISLQTLMSAITLPLLIFLIH